MRQFQNKLPLLTALFLSSLLSIALIVFRIFYSDSIAYIFLSWNLFLAWIPLWSALGMWWLDHNGYRAKFLIAMLLGCWLLFLPNAPYMVTDLMHLRARSSVPLWYDVVLIFSFAWNGVILGFTSLWIVQQLIARWFGTIASWLLVGFTFAASGFGVYLGRFQRWNSWDILTNPYALMADIAAHLTNPLDHMRTVGVTILFAGFLTITYITVLLLASSRWTPGYQVSKSSDRKM